MTPRAERIEDRLRSMAAQHRCGCGHPACNRCDDDRENAAALAPESGGPTGVCGGCGNTVPLERDKGGWWRLTSHDGGECFSSGTLDYTGHDQPGGRLPPHDPPAPSEPCTSTSCYCEMGHPDESCTDRRPIPEPNALDEQHVQFVAAPVGLIEAMNGGGWRKGVIIFRGPHGEEARMYLHGIEPWPMVAPSSPAAAQGEGT